MTEPVRVRFAPSPTGHLHVGGARTALFNWLFARHAGGTFILRIEDTDRNRSTEESIDQILESMKWLGLDWDEGPFRQTERQDLYLEHANRLLNEGKAYRCYCTPEELETRKKEMQEKGQKPKYDGRCRERTDHPDAPYVIRFKTPMEGVTEFTDLLRGVIQVENKELDDLVILRSDGTPTYNFVVVVDDCLMNITHVIRGDDHLSNTPRQIQLFRGFGFPLPKFAHVSTILGADKARLSKRHGATAILSYREQGYLPEALVNYLVRLGWSYGDQEIFNMEELVRLFTLDSVNTSAAVFNPEKLLWVNEQWIQKLEPERLLHHLSSAIALKDQAVFGDQAEPTVIRDGKVVPARPLEPALPLFRTRSKTLVEMAEGLEFYLKDEITYDPQAEKKFLKSPADEYLRTMIAEIEKGDRFDEAHLEQVVRSITDRWKVKLVEVAQPVRVALTGKTTSPGLFETMTLLGKERVLVRLRAALEGVRKKTPPA